MKWVSYCHEMYRLENTINQHNYILIKEEPKTLGRETKLLVFHRSPYALKSMLPGQDEERFSHQGKTNVMATYIYIEAVHLTIYSTDI